MQIPASISGISTIVDYDPSRSGSVISAQFARAHSLHRRNGLYLLPVTVRTTSGTFTCKISFKRDESAHHSVVLGKDWYNFCLEAIPGSGLVFCHGTVEIPARSQGA